MKSAFRQRAATGRLALALALVFGVAGLARGGDTATNGDYQIQPLDTIHIDVFGETNLCKDCNVRADGDISYPLVGNVAMAGLTTVQAQDKLHHLLLEWLVKPDVTVSVLKYGERFVVVTGQVTKQGRVILPGDRKWTIPDAIAQAGGFTNLANQKKIRFMRNGKAEILDYRKLVNQKDPSKKIYLKSGDVIIVPESLL